MRLHFWFTRDGIQITPPSVEDIDADRYARLVWRTASEILDPLSPIFPPLQPKLPWFTRTSHSIIPEPLPQAEARPPITATCFLTKAHMLLLSQVFYPFD